MNLFDCTQNEKGGRRENRPTGGTDEVNDIGLYGAAKILTQTPTDGDRGIDDGKEGASMNAYEEMRNRHMKEIGEFPCFFAFNDRQFEEGMAKLGVKDEKELYQGFAGMIYRKEDAGKLKELLERQDREIIEAFKDDKIMHDAFVFELANHEYCVTYDESDALDALGISQSDLMKDGRLADIFAKARADYLDSVVC